MFGRAFILDDQPAMAGTAALLVAMLGYEAIQCNLPTEALRRLQAESFDVLLTDYEMPLLTGLDVVERLRQEDCLIPVVMMSGNAGRIDRSRAWRLGVTTILSKPFGMDELAEALRSTRGSIAP
jgi:two-component system response regulator (stage 0 sporulation protein F)